jgi:aromatic ring-opening dioxygenase catalytic subunit (LigB family)
MPLPAFYIPHGGGPCFFMDWSMGPADMWVRMGRWLSDLGRELPEAPRALLVVSAHWEESRLTVTTGTRPPLIYDYYGFPPHTYELTWPAPGSPELAERVQALLGAAGIPAGGDGERGFDHGVFIPLKLSFPEADLPTVQLSLKAGLHSAEHLAIGRALAPLRSEGVLLIGSGMSYHNLRAMMRPEALHHSRRFDAWLGETVALERGAREERLSGWAQAPSARDCHPREEHLLPLMVVAGAADEAPGSVVFRDEVLGAVVSAVRF